MPRSPDSFFLLLLLLLHLLPTTLPRKLILELTCFRPREYPGAIRQQISLCIPACRDFSFDQVLPLGTCAPASDETNVPRRLTFNISNAPNPSLRIYAMSVWRENIKIIRRTTVSVTFDLTNVQPWLESGPSLPANHELKAKEWKVPANLSIRGAWAIRRFPETTTSTATTLTTTMSTTTTTEIVSTTVVPVVIALPLWAFLVAGLGLFSLVICVVVLLTLWIRRHRSKKKKKQNYDFQLSMQRRRQADNNPYNLRESRQLPDEIYDDLEYTNSIYGNRERYENRTSVLYEDPGTVYSMERENSWNNDAYGAPNLPSRPQAENMTARYTRR